MNLRQHVSVAASAIAVAASFGLATASPASASTVTRTHDGIAVSTPSSRTVSGSAVTKVTPTVRVQSGADRTVSRERITAYRSGAKVTSGSYVKLHAGSYTVAVTVSYRRYTVSHAKRVYGPVHVYTFARQALVVHKKTTSGGTSGSTTHSCTTTSSGSCIRGGEFCPQASYGQIGYSADGSEYICEGDTTHPHWELP